MFRRSRALAATATVTTLFAASLVLSSCTNPIEQFIEDQTGVSIDSDGDGSVTVESEDGEMTITAGTEVPDDFPGEVPLPSTGTLESSVAMAGAWNLTYTGVDETTLDSVVGALESAGFAQTYEMTAGDYAQSTWDNGTWTVSLIWDLSSDGALNISVVATP